MFLTECLLCLPASLVLLHEREHFFGTALDSLFLLRYCHACLLTGKLRRRGQPGKMGFAGCILSRNTKAKLAAKKAEGHKLGRPAGSKRISPKVIENLSAIRKYEKAGVSQEAIAKLIGVSRSTLIRNLRRVEEEGVQER